jgi:putative oxidoreductase
VAGSVVEMIGGLAILIGAFTALVSVPLIIVILVAMFKVHLKFGFSSIKTIGLLANGRSLEHPVLKWICGTSRD